MKEQVFVDASAWIAVWHPKDKHHKKAAKIYERLIVEQIPLIVTNWTAYDLNVARNFTDCLESLRE